MKVGVFDSGIGGLSVVKQILRTRNAHIVYVADTANMPYGLKSPDQIRVLSERITEFLLTQHVDYIVIACHTISAISGPYLAAKYPHIAFITMLEVVVPAALKTTKTNRIGIMATPATILAQVHKHALQYSNPRITVFEQPCPTLASTIEHQFDNHALIEDRITQYVSPLIAHGIDTLILGCTHYDLIQNEIQDFVGSQITIISSGRTPLPLLPKPREQKEEGALTIECYVSGNQDMFTESLVHIIDPAMPVSIRKF
ncbi:MAG: glutamate racemase [Candidatus Babeliales bacterium]